MTFKFNDLSRTTSVSSINAGHPRAEQVRVWAEGSGTHYQLTHFPRAAFLWPSRGQAEALFLQLPLKMDQSPSPHKTSVLFLIRQSASMRWWQGKVAETGPQSDPALLLFSLPAGSFCQSPFPSWPPLPSALFDGAGTCQEQQQHQVPSVCCSC